MQVLRLLQIEFATGGRLRQVQEKKRGERADEVEIYGQFTQRMTYGEANDPESEREYFSSGLVCSQGGLPAAKQ